VARYYCVPPVQLSDWNAMTDVPAIDPIVAGDFAPYDFFNYDSTGAYATTGLGLSFPLATYRAGESYAWIPSAPGGTNMAAIAGTALTINNATVEADNGLFHDVPLGPIEIMFLRSGSPVRASAAGIFCYPDTTLVDDFGTWTTNPYDNMLVTPLAADGSDLAAASAMSSLSVETDDTWRIYAFTNSSPYLPGVSSIDYHVLPTTCYGIRIEHADPGNDNPYVLVIRGLFIELTLSPLTTYLRQRQSPVRAPSRVRPPVVRQRQRPEVTT
jgi:hypothetical protein